MKYILAIFIFLPFIVSAQTSYNFTEKDIAMILSKVSMNANQKALLVSVLLDKPVKTRVFDRDFKTNYIAIWKKLGGKIDLKERKNLYIDIKKLSSKLK